MKRSLLTPIFLAVLFAAQDSLADPLCPPPSVEHGGQCVLRGDAVLSATMSIPSGTKLNCQGHRLTPVTTGTLDDPRTPANEFQPSQPELAIFVHRAYDVKIQNCVISGFDFGIIVAQSKSATASIGPGPAQNKILDNNIEVRTNAIDIMKSDDVLISGNRLTYASERGRGVVLNFDSDSNEVSGNTITSTATASTGIVRVLPGGAFVDSTAIMDNGIHVLQADSPLRNFVVSGVLFQITANDPASTNFEDSGRSEHNLLAQNDIVHMGGGASCTFDPATFCRSNADCSGKGACLLKQHSGIAFDFRASDATVSGNRISGHMDRGVSFAGTQKLSTVAGWYPGTCSLDASRLCSTGSDCTIPGFDTADKGVCNGAAPATINGNSLRLTATGNKFGGVYDNAALFANFSDQFTFSSNAVYGGASGIRINANAINGLIERNVVSGAATALHLQPAFTHTIRLNDFTGYSIAIGTSNDFTIQTDISADKGNYWGLPCPGFDPLRVLFDNGVVNPFVFDGKPYGRPVAQTSAGQPSACR